MPTFLQQVAGKTGRAIDVVGGGLSRIGIRGPETNLSESLQAYGGARPGSNYVYVPPSNNAQVLGYSDAVSYPQQGPAYPGPYKPTSNSGSGYQAPSNNQTVNDLQSGNINQNMETGYDQVDNDYNVTMQSLSGQEEGLRSQAGVAEQSAQLAYKQGQGLAEQKQASQLSSIAGEESTARKNETSGLQTARDLFRQVQQNNIAQLSGLGISSSSVSEALAEKLGVETARRVSGITGSTQEVIQNLAKEKTNVVNYFQDRVQTLKDNLDLAIKEVQSGLLTGITQINNAKNQAAADKANRRASIWQTAQNALNEIQVNFAKSQQALKEWYEKKNATLTDFEKYAYKSTDWAGQQQAIQGISSLPAVGGFSAVPNYEDARQGYVKITPKYQKSNEEEELSF